MTETPNIPVIPEGMVIATDLPEANGLIYPRIRVVYEEGDRQCGYTLSFDKDVLSDFQRHAAPIFAILQVARELAEYTRVEPVTTFYQALKTWYYANR